MTDLTRRTLADASITEVSELNNSDWLFVERSGSASKISGQNLSLKTTVFSTVADMVADTRLTVGDKIRTLGYNSAGDGGATDYVVVAAGTGTADGGEYIDLTGSSLQAQAKFNRVINPVQWGAVGDGSTDDTDEFNAMLDYVKVTAQNAVFVSDDKKDFWARFEITGVSGKVFAISSELDLNFGHRNCRFRDLTLKAIGSWAPSGITLAATFDTVSDMVASATLQTGDYVKTTGYASTGDGRGEYYEIVADGTAHGGEDGVTYIDVTGSSLQAKRVNLYMFNCGALATYIEWNNVQINCANICGGIKGVARNRIVGCWIEQIRHVGIEGAGSDVWIDRCMIYQWDKNDVEYYDKDLYTGIGIQLTSSDARVTSCNIAWLYILIELESTNNIIQHCHMFNGMKDYVAADRDGTLDSALDSYFGSETDSTDFTRRDNHIGMRVGYVAGASGKFWASTFDNVYWDNCHHELYVDGIYINKNKFGSKSDSSLLTEDEDNGGNTNSAYNDSPTIDYWFKLYAYEASAATQFRMDAPESWVTSAIRRWVKFASYDGNDWAADYSDFNTNTTYNSAEASGATQIGDGFHMAQKNTHIHDPNQGPAVTFYGLRGNSKVAFIDKDSTNASEVKGIADRLLLRPNDTTVIDLNTSGADVTGYVDASTYMKIGSYTVAGAPSATTIGAGGMIYVTNGDAGSACLAVSDGTNWKVVSLGATISAT